MLRRLWNRIRRFNPTYEVEGFIEGGLWYWRVKGRDGRVIIRSTYGYSRKIYMWMSFSRFKRALARGNWRTT